MIVYDIFMEETKDIKKIVAKNLANLRKNKKLTQTELAERFGYSDKAISKWENGDTLPDIQTLYQLCEFYNVTLDFLVNEQNFEDKIKYINHLNRKVIINNSMIELLYCSFVWILAVIIYIYLLIFSEFDYWQIFIWALPATSLVMLLFSKVWKQKIYTFVVRSLFFWTLVIACYIQFIQYNIWPLFFLMIPIQVALILAIAINDKLKIIK